MLPKTEVYEKDQLQPGDMTFTNYFGPPILEVRLPNHVLERMIEITDKVLEKNNPIRYGANLAGQIVDELAVPKQDLIDTNVYDYFELVGKQFIVAASNMLGSPVDETFRDRIRTQITNMWLVNQIEGEYNPVHLHTRCSISAVMYLKIPEYEERCIPNKRTQDGDITFVYKSAGDPVNSFERSLLSLKPEVGRMYMFPSTLLHTVYPFLGNGNRVSVSFNMIHSVLDDNEMPSGIFSDVLQDNMDKFEGEVLTEWEAKTKQEKESLPWPGDTKLEPRTKWFYPKDKK